MGRFPFLLRQQMLLKYWQKTILLPCYHVCKTRYIQLMRAEANGSKAWYMYISIFMLKFITWFFNDKFWENQQNIDRNIIRDCMSKFKTDDESCLNKYRTQQFLMKTTCYVENALVRFLVFTGNKIVCFFTLTAPTENIVLNAVYAMIRCTQWQLFKELLI